MEIFNQIVNSNISDMTILEYVINFFLTAILSYFLSLVYNNYSTTISNKDSFAKIFVLISTTTMLIITIIKSSLALSLGLVGALSIIRFRTAIKEPEELAYLFIAIALGLGFGANQTYITIISFLLLICIIIFSYYLVGNKISDHSMYITIQSQENKNVDIDVLSRVLGDNCKFVKLRRYDKSNTSLEAIFLVELNEINSIKNIEHQINNIKDNIKISFIEQDLSMI